MVFGLLVEEGITLSLLFNFSIYRVLLAENVQSGEKVALKVMKHGEGSVKKKVEELYTTEIAALRELDNESILKVLDCSGRELVTNTFNNEIEIRYIAMEYVENGEIFDYLSRGEKFSEMVVRYYFRQLIEIIEYIHSKGYAHRDIKPENLLLDTNFNMKIVDFGFCTKESQ